ncbi:MAG: trypsin-like peptidase domain-containing protein [Rhodobacteraceae bacterium]|nr:trypsin-like peptidase domain-containing protein [Paracoccaceae bacterium]
MRRLAWLLIWLALAQIPAQAQHAQALDALHSRGKMLGWEAVGRLDMPGGFCTGTLISSDLVLTAAHCVVDPEAGSKRDPDAMVFRVGYANGREIALRKVVEIAIAEGFAQAAGQRISGDMMGRDVALLRLDARLTSLEADPFQLHGFPDQGDRVSVVSYGQGRSESLSYEDECAVTGRFAGGVMAFDCNVTFGSSGAPVFAREDTSNRMRILSLISAGHQSANGRSVAFGPELPELVETLKRSLRHRSAPVPVTKGAKRVTVGQRNPGFGARFVRP